MTQEDVAALEAPAKLACGITRGLLVADIERHWPSLLAYAVPQAALRPAGASTPAHR